MRFFCKPTIKQNMFEITTNEAYSLNILSENKKPFEINGKQYTIIKQYWNNEDRLNPVCEIDVKEI